MIFRHLTILACGAAALALAANTPAMAQQRPVRIDIAAKPVASALQELARKTGANILFTPSAVASLQARPVRGVTTPAEAARRMVEGTQLEVIEDGSGALIVRQARTTEAAERPATLRRTAAAAVEQTAYAAPMGTAAVQSDTSPAEAPETAAAPAPAEAPQQEIVVTAQRREERLRDVPITVSAFSASRLAESGASASKDLFLVTPGLTFPTGGAYAQPTIRGIGTTITSTGNDPNVAVYVDGVYMPNQSANFFDFNNVRQIEVLKGPQGTLFGRNATGGAILVTTLDPSLTAPELKLGASYGSFDEVKLNGYVSTPLGESAAIDLSALYHDDNGYAHDAITGAKLAFYRELSFRSKLLVEPSDSLKVVISGDYSDRDDITGYTIKPLDGNVAAPAVISPDPRAFALSFVPVFSTKGGGASAQIVYDMGDVSLKSTTAYRKARSRFRTDLDRSHLASSDVQYTARQKTFTQELLLSSTGAHTFNWVVGAFAFIDHASNDGFRISGGPVTLESDLKARAYAAFADGNYAVTDRLTATAGIRFSTEKKIFDAVNPVVGVPQPTKSKRWSSWTPRFALRYAVTDDLNAYASYSRGFKSGTYNTQAVLGERVDPEKVQAGEVGVKYYAHGVTFNTSGFYYDYKDIQIQSFTPGATALNTILNAARAKIYGLDTEVSAPLTDGLDLSLSGAWTHARYKDFPNAIITIPKTTAAACGANPNRPCGNIQTSGDASGNKMVRQPDFTASATLTYRTALADGELLTSATGYYSSSFFWNAGNRLKQPSYFLLNGRIAWTTPDERWTFSLWGRNLTDKLYELYANDSASSDAVAYARPRSVGVSVDFKLR